MENSVEIFLTNKDRNTTWFHHGQVCVYPEGDKISILKTHLYFSVIAVIFTIINVWNQPLYSPDKNE